MLRRLLPLIALLAAVPAFAQPDLTGDWSGALDAGGLHLTLIFHLVPSDAAPYAVTLDVPEQRAYGFPSDSVAVAGDSLFFVFSSIDAVFAGAADEAASAIAGTWTQGARVLPLTLTPYEAPAEETSGASKPGPKPEHGDLSGEWSGALAIPGGGEVRTTLFLTRTDDGYEAALTGPDGERHTVDTVTVNGHDVTISNGAPAIEIVGTVSDDEATIEGEWHQNGEKLPATFTRR